MPKPCAHKDESDWERGDDVLEVVGELACASLTLDEMSVVNDDEQRPGVAKDSTERADRSCVATSPG